MRLSRQMISNFVIIIAMLNAWWAGRWLHTGEILPTAGRSRVQRQFQLLAAPAHPTLRLDPTLSASASAQLTENISAESAIVLDVGSKRILWQKNAERSRYPASTTKIITALVAREFYDLDDIVTITAEDLKYGQNVSWTAGEQVRVRDLLHALLIVSANEAGMILADHIPGGYDAFVGRMNAKAVELGMTRTSFDNPQGFDADHQRVSAHDLAIAALELLRDDFLRDIVATPATAITTLDGNTYQLTNTNQLLTKPNLGYEVKGIKTGTTALANEALVSLLERGEQQIIIVVLSTKMRYNDTMQIADYIFGNYVWQEAAQN